MELVQEIHQLLMDREDTCHRTCFSLQLNGNSLDNFAELKTVEGKNIYKQAIKPHKLFSSNSIKELYLHSFRRVFAPTSIYCTWMEVGIPEAYNL